LTSRTGIGKDLKGFEDIKIRLQDNIKRWTPAAFIILRRKRVSKKKKG